jgi:RNA polymerase sigma factor (sigma-70 family)
MDIVIKKGTAQDRQSDRKPQGYKNRSTLNGHADKATRLMRKVANDDIDAFERLYNEFNPILRRLFANYNHHPILLDDLIQEIFTRLWEQRKNYRGTSCFLTYLLGIARYTLKEKIIQSYKIARMGDLQELSSFTLGTYGDLSQPELQFYLKELADAVQKTKAKLTPKQQQALALSQSSETSFHKVSLKIGCSPNALRCRLKRARRRSRELLKPILDNQ